MKISAAMIEALVKLLQSAGLLKEPKEEIELRKALVDLAATEAKVWAEFVRATSPDAARVYIWVNSFIALIRPVISTLLAGAMVFAPARILDLVRTFGESGAAGWIVMAPVLWWFFGRDVSKVLAMRYGGLIPVGSGAAEPKLPEEGRSEERLERISDRLERMEEVDREVGSIEQLEPALERSPHDDDGSGPEPATADRAREEPVPGV